MALLLIGVGAGSGVSGTRTDTIEVVSEFGAVGNGTTDNTTAIQAAIDEVSTAYPKRGATLEFRTGVYKTGPLSLPNANLFSIGWKGLGSVGANGLDVGVKLVANADNITLFNFDAGASVRQAGPSFENLGIDGGGHTGVTAVALRLVNRAYFRRVAFSNLAAGVTLDSALDTISGGDCSWHQFDACTWYRPGIGIDARHSYGFVVNGGDMVLANADTGIKLRALATGNVPSQWAAVTGMKFDGGAVHVDTEGGASTFTGCGHESKLPAQGGPSTVGYKIRHTVTNNLSGGANKIYPRHFGNLVAPVDVGAGCPANWLFAPTYTNCTNTVVDASGNLVVV